MMIIMQRLLSCWCILPLWHFLHCVISEILLTLLWYAYLMLLPGILNRLSSSFLLKHELSLSGLLTFSLSFSVHCGAWNWPSNDRKHGEESEWLVWSLPLVSPAWMMQPIVTSSSTILGNTVSQHYPLNSFSFSITFCWMRLALIQVQ